MKIKIIFFVLFFVNYFISISQTELKCPTVSTDLQQAFDNRIVKIDDNYSSEDYKDLEFLKDIIGNKRFVLLGESSHYVEEYSKIKYRLIKFLHQEMNFDVVLFESDFFNCNTSYLISDSLSVNEFLNNSIFDLWHTKVNYNLFEYIKETKKTESPLFFSGFDIRKSNITDNQLLYEYYKKYLSLVDYAEFVDLDIITNKYFREVILLQNKKAFNSSLSLELSKRYDIMLKDIDKYPNDIERKTFKRIITNKKNQIQIIEVSKGNMLKYMNMRDRLMAENIEWIAENLYPDKKIIIWAHNEHISINKLHKSNVVGTPNMGYYLSEKFKNQLYSVGIFGLKGSWGYNNDNVRNEDNLKKNSLETIICSTKNEISFINLNEKLKIDYNKKVYLWQQKKTISRIRKEYNGLLFIRNFSPSSYINK